MQQPQSISVDRNYAGRWKMFSTLLFSELLSTITTTPESSLSKQRAESADFKSGQHLGMHKRSGLSLRMSVHLPWLWFFPFCYLSPVCYLFQFAWSTRELNPRPRRQKRDKGVNNSSQGALAFCMQFNLHLKTWTFLRTVSRIYLNCFWIQVGWTEMVK